MAQSKIIYTVIQSEPVSSKLLMIAIPHMGVLGTGAILLGATVRWKIAKRRFKRRTITGLEWFPSYAAGIFTKCFEWVALVVARLLIFGGILLILASSV